MTCYYGFSSPQGQTRSPPCLVSSGYWRRERPGLEAHYVPPLSTLRTRGTVHPLPPILYVSVAFVLHEKLDFAFKLAL